MNLIVSRVNQKISKSSMRTLLKLRGGLTIKKMYVKKREVKSILDPQK